MTTSASSPRAEHWERVYTDKGAGEVSWFAPQLDTSLALIDGLALPKAARIVDVGGGASTLVDDLIARGYGDVTVLDLSQAALDLARGRLGDRGACVRWVQGDVTRADLGCAAFDVWHDRAVFHFLTDPADRAAYLERVCCSLRTGGHVIIGTFAPDGPARCSGLPVVRYSAETLEATFGAAFERVAEASEQHVTPWGTVQSFVYCLCYKALDC